MKKLVFLVIILLFSFLGYYLYTPYIFLNKLNNSIESGEYEQVTEYFDFELIRESLKKDLSAYIRKEFTSEELSSSSSETELGSLIGGMIGSYVAEGLGELIIDFFVTPEAMVVLLSGEIPGFNENSLDSDVSNSSLFDGAEYRYTSLNNFNIVLNEGQEEQIIFNMTREGLGWKIVGIDLYN